MIFPHNFFSGDDLFVYDYDDNNVVVLIHPTSESADKTESDIIYEEVVDAMGDDMLKGTKKNDKICDESDSSCGEEHEIDNDT